MGLSLLWTLGFLMFDAVFFSPTEASVVTLDGPKQPVYLGDTVYLTCKLRNQSYVTFYKNGAFLKDQDPSVITSRHDFKIDSGSTEDQIYSCGTTHYRRMSCEIKLNIQEKRRRIILTSSDRTIPEQGHVTLTCDIEGYKGSYYWRSRDPEWTTNPSTRGTVIITRGGVYTCSGYDGYVQTEDSNSVTILEHDSSSYPEHPYFVHICVIISIILLILILLYVTKDKWCCRTTPLVSTTNQSAARDHMITDDARPYMNITPLRGERM